MTGIQNLASALLASARDAQRKEFLAQGTVTLWPCNHRGEPLGAQWSTGTILEVNHGLLLVEHHDQKTWFQVDSGLPTYRMRARDRHWMLAPRDCELLRANAR